LARTLVQAANPKHALHLKRNREYRARLKAKGRLALSGRALGLRLISDLRRAQPCMDCKLAFPACCMDFDHRPGEPKTDAVSAMSIRHSTFVWDLMAEIEKCDVVCANCHRIRTKERSLS
jgi:hypothetical protein